MVNPGNSLQRVADDMRRLGSLPGSMNLSSNTYSVMNDRTLTFEEVNRAYDKMVEYSRERQRLYEEEMYRAVPRPIAVKAEDWKMHSYNWSIGIDPSELRGSRPSAIFFDEWDAPKPINPPNDRKDKYRKLFWQRKAKDKNFNL